MTFEDLRTNIVVYQEHLNDIITKYGDLHGPYLDGLNRHHWQGMKNGLALVTLWIDEAEEDNENKE